jgi:hypothetical protein
MEICPVRAAVIYADRTDMAKLIGAFSNYASTPKIKVSLGLLACGM